MPSEEIPFPDVIGVKFVLVPGASRYCVGDDGSLYSRIRRVWLPENKGKPVGVVANEWSRMKPWTGDNGYVRVCIHTDSGQVLHTRLHLIVLRSFLGPPPIGHQCLHGDGDRSNNRLTNLRWGTRTENMADRDKHSRHLKGCASKNAKLTSEDVKRVFKLSFDGLNGAAISRIFGCDKSVIYRVLRGDCYKTEVEKVLAELAV